MILAENWHVNPEHNLASEMLQINRLTNGEAESDRHDQSSAGTNVRPCYDKNSEANNLNGRQSSVNHKKVRKAKDMTLQDMYSSQVDFDDDDDNDMDWEPQKKSMTIMKWFCTNCTTVNLDDVVHCDVCGEYKDSGIVKYGFFASPYSHGASLPQVESEVLEQRGDLGSQNSASENSTAVGFDERMLLHSEVEMKSHPHPERPDRLRAIAASLAAAGIFPGRCYLISAREITLEELQMVHSSEHIEAVERTSHIFSSYFTLDTYANEHSARAARLAAGLCADLASAVFSGRVKNGFALVRPPGHHAGVKQAMGFCLHNNAAVAALAAQAAGSKKVLIVDWDVHHGNGTQEIFEQNKSVLYISLHRHEGGKFYPGTGAADEVGTMGAEGYSVNVPWSRGGVGDHDYIFAFQHIVLPIASEFAPDLTIISAGFDAARGDPLGCCDVTPPGFGLMTHMLNSVSGGKLLVILEGGYNLRSISSSATAVIKVLLGEIPDSAMDNLLPSKAGLKTVMEVLKIQMNFWPTLGSSFAKLQSQWGSYSFKIKDAPVLTQEQERKLKEVKECSFKDLGDLLPKDPRAVAPYTRPGGYSLKKGAPYTRPDGSSSKKASKRVVASRYSSRSPPSSKVARTDDAPRTKPPPQSEAPSVATSHASVPGPPPAPSAPPFGLPRTEASIRGSDFSIPMMGRPQVIKKRLDRFVFGPEVRDLENLGVEKIVDTYLEGLAQVSTSSICLLSRAFKHDEMKRDLDITSKKLVAAQRLIAECKAASSTHRDELVVAQERASRLESELLATRKREALKDADLVEARNRATILEAELLALRERNVLREAELVQAHERAMLRGTELKAAHERASRAEEVLESAQERASRAEEDLENGLADAFIDGFEEFRGKASVAFPGIDFSGLVPAEASEGGSDEDDDEEEAEDD